MEVRRRPRAPPFFVARARSKAMRARAFFGLGRWEWGGGTRRKSIPGGSWAPCSFVQSCTNGKTGVGRPAQPVRRMRRTHGAQRSRHPTPTSPRHIAVLTETSGATARCFHVRSWLKLLCGQGLLRWAACVRRAGQRYRQSFGNRPYLVSIACAWPACAACFACPWLPINRRGWGWVGLRDPPPHGCGGGAYTDVLAACPASPPSPAQPVTRANQGFGSTLCALRSSKLLKKPYPRRDRHTLSPINNNSPIQIAAKPIALAVSNGSRKKNTPSNNPRLGAMYCRIPTSDSGIRFTP